MSGPLYFNGTGQDETDAILDAIDTAACCYNDTRQWTEDGEDAQVSRIQNAADAAAKELARLREIERLAIAERHAFNAYECAQGGERRSDAERAWHAAAAELRSALTPTGGGQ